MLFDSTDITLSFILIFHYFILPVTMVLWRPFCLLCDYFGYFKMHNYKYWSIIIVNFTKNHSSSYTGKFIRVYSFYDHLLLSFIMKKPHYGYMMAILFIWQPVWILILIAMSLKASLLHIKQI
jgi:hypothetical protein